MVVKTVMRGGGGESTWTSGKNASSRSRSSWEQLGDANIESSMLEALEASVHQAAGSYSLELLAT